MAINNVSSIRADAEREIHSESENLEIIIYTRADEVEQNFLNHFLIDVKLGQKHQ